MSKPIKLSTETRQLRKYIDPTQSKYVEAKQPMYWASVPVLFTKDDLIKVTKRTGDTHPADERLLDADDALVEANSALADADRAQDEANKQLEERIRQHRLARQLVRK